MHTKEEQILSNDSQNREVGSHLRVCQHILAMSSPWVARVPVSKQASQTALNVLERWRDPPR